MTHIIVLFGGLFVGALAGVLVMAALIAAGTASELERRFAGADGPRRKIAGPSGDSPSYFRGPGIGSPIGDPSPSPWDSMRRVDDPRATTQLRRRAEMGMPPPLRTSRRPCPPHLG